jgi:hypothetical protein
MIKKDKEVGKPLVLREGMSLLSAACFTRAQSAPAGLVLAHVFAHGLPILPAIIVPIRPVQLPAAGLGAMTGGLAAQNPLPAHNCPDMDNYSLSINDPYLEQQIACALLSPLLAQESCFSIFSST